MLAPGGCGPRGEAGSAAALRRWDCSLRSSDSSLAPRSSSAPGGVGRRALRVLRGRRERGRASGGWGWGADRTGSVDSAQTSAETGTHAPTHQPPPSHPGGHSASASWREGFPLSHSGRPVAHTLRHTYRRGRVIYIYRLYISNSTTETVLGFTYPTELPTFCPSPPERLNFLHRKRDLWGREIYLFC